MKSFSFIALICIAFFAFPACAQNEPVVQSEVEVQPAPSKGVVVKDEELKNLVAGQGVGTTWVLANNRKFSFFSDGTFIDCSGKKNFEVCSIGSFEVMSDHVLDTYRKDPLKTNDPVPLRQVKLFFRKNKEQLNVASLEVLKYSVYPELSLATEDQIRSLAGKKVKFISGDKGEISVNFNKDMTFQICSQRGCENAFDPKITKGDFFWVYGSPHPGSASALILKDTENLLWKGKPLTFLD